MTIFARNVASIVTGYYRPEVLILEPRGSGETAFMNVKMGIKAGPRLAYVLVMKGALTVGNFGFCRFRNTEGDLSDCLEAIEDRKISNRGEALAAKRMIKEILHFAQENGLADNVNFDRIDEVVAEAMSDEAGDLEDDTI
jgi:hypothetical protein